MYKSASCFLNALIHYAVNKMVDNKDKRHHKHQSNIFKLLILLDLQFKMPKYLINNHMRQKQEADPHN